MTSAGVPEAVTGRRPPVRGIFTLLRRLVSLQAWRATFHVVAGTLLGAGVTGVLILVCALWWSAVYSLTTGPTGHWILIPVYVFATATGPVAVMLCVRFASVLQRERFRALLDIDIVAPPRTPAQGWRMLLPWTGATIWRQLAYHLLTPLLCGLGGVLVLICWMAPVLAVLWTQETPTAWRTAWIAASTGLLLCAPWVARTTAHADTAAALRLLGPSRTTQLAERVETLARSRADLLDAADAERRRIERDLHDGIQQRLVTLAMGLGMARASNTDDAAELRTVLAAAHDEVTAALTELRDFVRGLHPAVLNDRGLRAALSGVVARMPLPVRLHFDVAERCTPRIEAIAYFTVSEALTNVVKYSQASRADVTVQRTGNHLLVSVTDDGCGGATITNTGYSTDLNIGTGLRGLAQRAAAVDGTLTVTSPPGGPTTITAALPCA